MSDLKFFWGEVVGLEHGLGFNPEEYDWRETDVEGKPFAWNDDDNLYKQIPKPNDFIKVCVPAFEAALSEVIFPVDAPPAHIYNTVMEEVVGMVNAAFNIYNPQDPSDWMNVFAPELKKEVK